MRSKWIETKVKPRKWSFLFTYGTWTRPRKRRMRVKAKQNAIKTGKDVYRLVMTGRRY